MFYLKSDGETVGGGGRVGGESVGAHYAPQWELICLPDSCILKLFIDIFHGRLKN